MPSSPSSADTYKKYRPSSFGEIIGTRQQAIVRAINSHLKQDAMPTGFIFAGPAGTGKTSLARLVAKADNCLNRGQSAGAFPMDPCNTCDVCQAIDADECPGVFYISLAGEGTVSDIEMHLAKARQSYAGIHRPYFILDEPQGISHAAWQRFLIPLEDDSQQSVFIFCTTKGQSIDPATATRCQSQAFALVEAAEMRDHLLNVAELEGTPLDEQALARIVIAGRGSVRRALTAYDKYIAGGLEGDIATDLLTALITEQATVSARIAYSMTAMREAISTFGGEETIGQLFDLVTSAWEQVANPEQDSNTLLGDGVTSADHAIRFLGGLHHVHTVTIPALHTAMLNIRLGVDENREALNVVHELLRGLTKPTNPQPQLAG